MPRKLKKEKKDPVPIIYFNNGLGGTLSIKSPVLLSIFQSPKLLEEFKKDPHKKYSVKDIFELINKDIPVKEPTIRRALADNKEFFETKKEVEVINKKNSKTIMVINLTKFKPLAQYVFDAVETLWSEDDEDE